MTLPVSGAISFNNINVELGVAGTTQASLGQSSYRTLAGVASGAISMSNFYGKSNRATASYTFSANTSNASLNLSSLSGYSAGTTDITVTINSGIYVYSTSTGSYALTLSGATTGDTVTIVNNGYIMGLGGNGGRATYAWQGNTITPYAPTTGGPAINIASIGVSSITVTNTSGYIGGGGGGGGYGCASSESSAIGNGGGGGAGGGLGGGGVGYIGKVGYTSTPQTVTVGLGATGENGAINGYDYAFPNSGGGGGKIMPGTGGSGGTVGSNNKNGKGGGSGGGGAGGYSGTAGAGGSAGSAGSNGSSGNGYTAGGGGGWGASGGNCGVSHSFNPNGAAGGKAINLGGKSVTWTGGSSSSSRAYGAVS